ncbi:MAG: isoleucine--tRNA ligase [Alphaproteobacteria bacterium]|nr:isoleucine--tRNA ligase [Alphaproteobacteria bacterium]
MFRDLKNPVDLEAEVLAFWKANRTFEEGMRLSEGRPEFVFYEGPPTANGTPHNGHVLTRVIKDLFPRYKAMRGYHVRRKAGWDTHGLPVEVEVEKTLGIHGREAIEEYGQEPFARKCIDSVFTYTREWEEMTERVGFWVNLDDAYVTFHRSYVESVWWALSRLFKKGLLYQGHKVVWWWPQGGTALSAGEVGQGYKEVDDPSVTAMFKVDGHDDLYLLAWTTTPWTLPSNTAIAVNPRLDYDVVRVGDKRVVVASAIRETLFNGVDFGGAEPTVEQTLKGSELVGWRYAPLYRFAEPQGGDAWVVIPGDHVTTDAGSGMVHTAPAFGEVDFVNAVAHGVGLLQLVAPNGNFVEGTGFLAGRFCKDADRDIIADLKERGLLFKRETIRHDYPFCWRADEDPLIQYARPAWFIRTTALNAEALENNQAVHWLPPHIKDGRFGDFLRNNVDWALSRERFWGTPLNIWVCEGCGQMHAPASSAEILALNPDAFDPDVDTHLQIHRPWIDRVTLPCAACGGTMNRVPEVIDCWFDSGCMPFAQWGFPHQGVEDFKAQFPADFISEAVDQTRGWFYSLLMISTLLFDDETCAEYGLAPVGFPRPYRTCIVLGLVTDMDGKKESKSKGNYTSPDLVMKGEVLQGVVADDTLQPGQLGLKQAQVRSLNLGPKEPMTAVGGGTELALEVVSVEVRGKDTVHMHPDDIAALGCEGKVLLRAPFDPPGADAFRWLFYASNPPWSNTRLSLRAIREGQREFLIRLKNVHSFFAIYANIAGFDPNGEAPRPPAERSLLDRWILHELTALNRSVVENLDRYHLYEAARDITAFVDALSNWYVRRSRSRFWGEGPDLDDALWTLYEALTTLTRLIAPFVPFMAEAMYQALEADHVRGAARSVHHCAYPQPDEALLDDALAQDMALIRELASLGLAARAQVGVRVRQPLRAVEVVLADAAAAERLAPLLGLLTDELNVRAVHFQTEADRFVDFRVKPNYKALGRRLGKDMKHCAKALGSMPGASVRAQVLAGGLTLELPGGVVTLTEDDVVVEVSAREGFQATSSPTAVVALHADLDDDLREEGLSREIINRVQGVRKELDLGYTQRIALRVAGDPAVVAAAARFKDHIAAETLVRIWLESGADGTLHEGEVDGLALALTVRPL